MLRSCHEECSCRVTVLVRGEPLLERAIEVTCKVAAIGSINCWNLGSLRLIIGLGRFASLLGQCLTLASDSGINSSMAQQCSHIFKVLWSPEGSLR